MTEVRAPRVLVLGTLDTKGEEFAYLRDLLHEAGCETTIVDLGILGTPSFAGDVSREEVLARAGRTLDELRSGEHRGDAIGAVIEGGTAIVRDLHAQGGFDGVIAMGGGSGTTIGTSIMEALPFGVPKLVVTTLPRLHPHVRGTDVVVVRTMVDLVGLNPITRVHIRHAAGAIAGMAAHRAAMPEARRSVVITCLGVTTPGVMALRDLLIDAGKEVIVLHRLTTAVAHMLEAGLVEAMVDFTPNEITNYSVFPDGGDDRVRLKGLRESSIPLVLVPGALDMILNFVPADERPTVLWERPFVVHSRDATLIRTTTEEQGRMGRVFGAQLAEAKGPVAAVIPMGGFSMWDAPGRAFEQPDARLAFVEGFRTGGPDVALVEVDAHINDQTFALRVFDQLIELLSGTTEG